LTEPISITGVVLAGGRARRMGGADKGLLLLGGKSMIKYVLSELEPQVDQLLINANRHLQEYAAFGYPVVEDKIGDFAGPLAGLAAAMVQCSTTHILCVPCDGPRLPRQLAQRLRARLQEEHAEICVAHNGQRMQPVYALVSCRLSSSLESYLARGEHKIDRWYAEHRLAVEDFSDQAEAFANVNTDAELRLLESELQANPRSRGDC